MTRTTLPAFLNGGFESILTARLAAAGNVADARVRSLRPFDTEDRTKITAECTLADGTVVFVKIYSADGKENGAHCYKVMTTLRSDGFGPAGEHRIAEPLLYLPDARVLVTLGVGGTCLVDHLGSNSPEQIDGIGRAASWLARLHASPVRIGPAWRTWRDVHKAETRTIRAAAAAPGRAHRLGAMADALERLAARAEDEGRIVQTHGQFRDVHVFLIDGATSVIDFDRSVPGDPARDVDEFLHRLRWKTFKHTGTVPDEATATFLGLYAAQASPGNLVNLPFYSASHALASLARFLGKGARSDEHFEARVAFHENEFEIALRGGLVAEVG